MINMMYSNVESHLTIKITNFSCMQEHTKKKKNLKHKTYAQWKKVDEVSILWLHFYEVPEQGKLSLMTKSKNEWLSLGECGLWEAGKEHKGAFLNDRDII